MTVQATYIHIYQLEEIIMSIYIWVPYLQIYNDVDMLYNWKREKNTSTLKHKWNLSLKMNVNFIY